MPERRTECARIARYLAQSHCIGARFGASVLFVTNKNAWSRYIDSTSGGIPNTAIADRVGVDAATIGRWRTGAVDPKPRQVVAYARGFGLSPLQALAAADYVSEAELGLAIEAPRAYTLDDFTTVELVEEVLARLEAADGLSMHSSRRPPSLAAIEDGTLVPFVGSWGQSDHADLRAAASLAEDDPAEDAPEP